eukprot:739358-Pelagomonas_calceolata.AAC.4
MVLLPRDSATGGNSSGGGRWAKSGIGIAGGGGGGQPGKVDTGIGIGIEGQDVGSGNCEGGREEVG